MFSSRLPDSISFPIPLRSEAHSDAPMRAPSLHSSNPNHGSPFQNGPSYPTAQVSTDATTASKDLRRPAKHLLHSDTDEDSAPAKRIRSLDTQENDAEATANIKDTNTQQSHHGQPQQQQRAPKKKKWPPSSKQQINLMHRLKYNNTARMGKRAVVVFTENANMQSRKKVNDPHIYSYGLRVLGLPAELKAMIFSYLDFRTLGKACMGKNTKAGKMQGKIVVSSAELREVVWEGALEAFFARNEIPYSPAMAAALGVDNRYDYVLILFRFMLEKGCHGCGAGVYIGCHYWVFGKNFCGDCLKANLVDYQEAQQMFAQCLETPHTANPIKVRSVFDKLLEGTPHSIRVGRVCDRRSTQINPIAYRFFLREHVELRINEFCHCMRLQRREKMTISPKQVFKAYRFRDLTGGQNQAAPIRGLQRRANKQNMPDWLEFARVMELWAPAHDHRDS